MSAIPLVTGTIGSIDAQSQINNNSINSAPSSSSQSQTSNIDTLDEPVTETIVRFPNAQSVKKRLSVTAPDSQVAQVFTSVFVIIWGGSAVVTVNTKLLGGKLLSNDIIIELNEVEV
ncbi:hypothetical protein HK100_006751 [Physocladia obscura]|uniref:Uncharacterized protein n=1 Tax=Physocladia obscura TaxID=109957 RepID=A0AAD5SR23_9FUNG|nr:hypothetical protein HK100_006751 [Physocladia obscura]